MIFGLIGLASPFAVLLLLSTQAKLDRQLELSVRGASASLQAVKSSTSASAEATWSDDVTPAHTAEPTPFNKLATPIQPTAIEVVPAEGKKAVVVRVSNGFSAIDFAQPDRWVDVILTRQLETHSIFNDVIVQNARILAVDADADGHARPMARSVTLEVDLISAQKLLLASQIGLLSLILRRPGDDSTESVRQVAVEDLTSLPAEAVTAPTEPAVETTASIAPPAAATPEVAAVPAPAPTPTPDLAPVPTPSPTAASETNRPASEQDDPRFLWVRVSRPGAEPSVHKVPKEP